MGDDTSLKLVMVNGEEHIYTVERGPELRHMEL